MKHVERLMKKMEAATSVPPALVYFKMIIEAAVLDGDGYDVIDQAHRILEKKLVTVENVETWMENYDGLGPRQRATMVDDFKEEFGND